MVAVIANKRWRVLTGFGMSLFVLLVVSFLSYTGWGLPYVRAVLSDGYRGANLNINSYITFWSPDSRLPLGSIVALVLGIIVLLEWYGSIRSHFRRIVWVASLSLAVATLLGFAIFPVNHVVLILPLILILALVWERWHRRRVLATVLILSLVLILPFGLYLAKSFYIERIYSDLLTLLPPVAAIIGLYWMRWWAVRSPRPWLEQAGRRP
jgi:hypothetical protein